MQRNRTGDCKKKRKPIKALVSFSVDLHIKMISTNEKCLERHKVTKKKCTCSQLISIHNYLFSTSLTGNIMDHLCRENELSATSDRDEDAACC